MASFDVENLFTNIPLAETVEICLNYLFSGSELVLGLSRQYFRSLLQLSVMNSFFIFNGKLFQQLDGLGMGLPLGPTFANIFMCFHERSWIDDCPLQFRPVMYKRYVDDTFVLFREQSHAESFLNYLNSKHNCIKFTMECEQSNSISFLDCLVTRSNNKLQCSVYRKSTFSGLGTSFFSYCSFSFKINGIKTLLYRAYHVCSTYIDLHSELEFLKTFFRNNGFSRNLVEKQINQFLDSRFTTNNPITTVPLKLFYISLPYFGKQSDKMKTELSKLLSKYFPHINFKLIMVNNFRIGSFFNYKDKLGKGVRSSVVYKFSCAHCASVYVGSTARILRTRVAEHSGHSHRTGARLTTPLQSVVRSHAASCSPGAPVSLDQFEIIGTCSSSLDLRILESIHITKQKPDLNATESAFPLAIVNV